MAREIVVTSRAQDAYTVVVGPHQLVVDQPAAAGGTDLGPTPTDIFVAGLAACVAYYGGRYLRENDLPSEVTVRCRYKWAFGPNRVSKMEISVEAPGLTDEHRGGFAEAVDHCSVHNTLRQPPEVAVSVA
jgi:uncharacterized OsmC-like protein